MGTKQFSTRIDETLADWIEKGVKPFLIERGLIKKDSNFEVTKYAMWFLGKTVSETMQADINIVQEPATQSNNGIEGRVAIIESRLGTIEAQLANTDMALEHVDKQLTSLLAQMQRVTKTEKDLREELVNDQRPTGTNAGQPGRTSEDNTQDSATKSGESAKQPAPKKRRKRRN